MPSLRNSPQLLRAVQFGHAQCVGATFQERCDAIQKMVRPHEVQHIVSKIRCASGRHLLIGNLTEWWQDEMRAGRLRYTADPDDCDLWSAPSLTLALGAGDCDDLAIVAASVLIAGGDHASVGVGHLLKQGQSLGHAWVEGWDRDGRFYLFEATTGEHFHDQRPAHYKLKSSLRPGACAVA